VAKLQARGLKIDDIGRPYLYSEFKDIMSGAVEEAELDEEQKKIVREGIANLLKVEGAKLWWRSLTLLKAVLGTGEPVTGLVTDAKTKASKGVWHPLSAVKAELGGDANALIYFVESVNTQRNG